MINLDWYKTIPNDLDIVPEKAGLYIISVLLKNEEYGVIYVGQSDDLRSRVKSHFCDSESNESLREYLKNNFTFKVSYCESSSSKLDGLEKYLIYVYEPKFNTQEGNGDAAFECSLPNVKKW